MLALMANTRQPLKPSPQLSHEADSATMPVREASDGQSQVRRLDRSGSTLSAVTPPAKATLTASAGLDAERLQALLDKERRADQLQGLLKMLPTGVIVIGRRGHIEVANPAAEAMLDHPDLPNLVGELWGRVIKVAFQPRKHDGHEISLHNGRLVGLDTRALTGQGQLVVLNDLTATRQLQAEVSQHQRLAGIGRMVASMAHQIRTPLSAAMLYTENLREPTLSDHHRQRFAEKVQSRLEHLEQQVRDMLVFAKGEVRLVDRVTTVELVHQLRQATSAALERSGSHLNLLNEAEVAMLVCNRDTLIGALCNLVNNAIDAVGQNAALNLHIQAQHNHILLQLQDNGPGVPDKILSHLGEPFMTTKANGTGLGLAVVKAVARAHGGYFTLTNNAQGGLATLSMPEHFSKETAR